MIRSIAIASSLTLALASGALAGPIHAGDVFLTTDGGRITTGRYDAGVFTPGRVFGSEFGEIAPNYSDEPGFDNLPGTFTPGTSIGFNFRKALRVWNGSDFNTIAPVQIEFSYGPLGPVATPLTDVLTSGFSVAVAANGEWHEHYDMTILAPATDGVYLLEMELFSDQPGLGASLPFWFVFNQNTSELIHDEAIEYVEQNIVPAPGAAGLLAAGGLLGLRRRRR
jgi:hypothetical protein